VHRGLKSERILSRTNWAICSKYLFLSKGANMNICHSYNKSDLLISHRFEGVKQKNNPLILISNQWKRCFIWKVGLNVAIKHKSRLGGDTVRALWWSLLSVKQYGPPTLLKFTFGEVLYDSFHCSKTRLTKVYRSTCLPVGRGKCSRRVSLMKL
jgi:hypothetical protein